MREIERPDNVRKERVPYKNGTRPALRADARGVTRRPLKVGGPEACTVFVGRMQHGFAIAKDGDR
ncbi:hypothetical protein BOSE62_80076 [Bosea sp. 62]|nr:hypothetical protein BOSE21B_80079 [Bosea sp. 21B]CAD5300054.1 hypothetical protein BOSE7B_60730 [Bosea sp. 7B]VVT57159.1 hypothetical protein BOS5A_180083 [Bosea sp. EC-HK365B]VXB50071.1 hypothetical protein BOSE127_120194 [Bosea sp. 127]VXC69053.1 hypothetical protein BOSE29B_70055 [Bosea sp. 29B]VXC83756.1 hypothetical protein BOSE125_500005 [Bosea sp. 125]VXC95797.1 hypothetical protein BOSE62_80076 [Bosea sp. 62]